MAASMITNMALGRMCSLSEIASKTRSSVIFRSCIMQFHSSLYLSRGRPFRRKHFQVFLPQDDESKDRTKSHSQTQASSVKITGSLPSDTEFLNRKEQNIERGQFNTNKGDFSRTSDQVYSKASSDKRFSNAMALAKNRKQRDRSKQVVLEGYRLIRDALLAGSRCHTLFFSMISHLDGLPVNRSETELVKIPYKEIETWSDLATPQGIIGIFSKPTHTLTSRDESDPCLPLTLVCDNIREPGNLGTILRAATAANCEQILVTVGCVDIWDPKVLRAGAGAHFHTPITSRVRWSDVPNYVGGDVALHIADRYREGSEAISEGESLVRIPHSELDWSSRTGLVIGGETEGISQAAVELCRGTHGTRVYIPMSSGIDSLNAAMSATVLLFEAKRQWLLYQNKLKGS